MAKTAAQLEVEGLKELQKKAIQMLDDMRPGSTVLRRAMLDSMLKAQARAIKNPSTRKGGTPVGFVPVDTGRLRASIVPTVEPYGETLRGIVGTNVKYAPYQEFGTRRGVPAKRFMRAAYDETREWIQRRFGDAIKLILDKRP